MIKQKEALVAKMYEVELRQNKDCAQEHDLVRFAYQLLYEWDADLDWYYFDRTFDQLMSKHYYFRSISKLGFAMQVERLIKLHLLLQVKEYKDEHMLDQVYEAWEFFGAHSIEYWWDEIKIESEIKQTEKELKDKKICYGAVSDRRAYRVHFRAVE